MYKPYREFVWRDPARAKPLSEQVTSGLSATPGWHRVTVKHCLELGAGRWSLTVVDSFGGCLTSIMELEWEPSPGMPLEVKVGFSKGWSVERLSSGAFELLSWSGFLNDQPKRSGVPCRTYTEACKPAIDAGERKASAKICLVRTA